MTISEIHVQNFGKHSEVSFKTGMPVVGIIGSNGSGKSTLLTALKWLITGMLDDVAASYVKTGEKSAKAWAVFHKGGREGKIIRKITASGSASRELHWDGEVITSASKIEAKMAELLSADKQAVSNAVFIPQGELDKLLFGIPSEREMLFTRLMNVAFMQKTADIFDTKMKNESTDIEDLTAVLDEIRVQVTTAATTVSELKGRLSHLPDKSEELQAVLKDIQGWENVTKLNSAWVSATQSAERERQELGLILNAASCSNKDEVNTKLVEAEAVWQKAGDVAHAAGQILSKKKLIQRLKDEAVTAGQSKVALVERRTSVLGKLVPMERLKVLYQRVLELNKRPVLLKAAEAAQSKFATAGQELENHKRVEVPDPVLEVEALEAKIKVVQEKGTLVSQRISVLKTALDARAGAHECPVCSSKIDASIISEATIAALQSERQAQVEEYRTLSNLSKDLTDKRRAWVTKADALNTAMLTAFQEKLAADQALQGIAEGDLASVQAEYDSGNAAARESELVDAGIRSIDQRLEAIDQELKLTPADPAVLATVTDESLAALNAETQTKYDIVLRLRVAVSQINNAHTKAYAANAVADKAKTEYDTASAGMLGKLQLGELQPKGAVLTTQENDRRSLLGQVVQAELTHTTAQVRQREFEARMQKAAGRKLIVEDLRKLKDVFSRDGLPMAFVSHQFGRLVAVTQRNLSNMGADFTVAADPESPVTFCFTRLNEPGASALPQSKLSGGQKVRLAIAFLLAIQQLIIPEVGLLVLDEPTTHLDAEAVDSLRELLLGMSDLLRNSDHQIWVVDHHPTLQTAFGSCLSL